jgi:hypothetical protein
MSSVKEQLSEKAGALVSIGIHTFGEHNRPHTVTYIKVYPVHRMGAKILDHTGVNLRIAHQIFGYIQSLSAEILEMKPVVAIHCFHGLHRSVDIADRVAALVTEQLRYRIERIDHSILEQNSKEMEKMMT